MDTTVRNLDERLYREIKARAALGNTTIGELFNDAIRAYLEGLESSGRSRSLSAIRRGVESGAIRELSSPPEDLIREDRGR